MGAGVLSGGQEVKRGYSRDFAPTTERRITYTLDQIPAGFWKRVKAKAKRDGVSLRALILSLLKDWLTR